MGLDITAYEKVELVHAGTYNEAYVDDDDLVYLYNHDFPERSDGFVEGYYRFGAGDTCRFRAGSYSGYSRYRDRLAALVGTTAEAMWKLPVNAESPPAFFEQINFADNEGFLGPKTCTKLLADYEAHIAKVPDGSELYDDDFATLYRD